MNRRRRQTPQVHSQRILAAPPAAPEPVPAQAAPVEAPRPAESVAATRARVVVVDPAVLAAAVRSPAARVEAPALAVDRAHEPSFADRVTLTEEIPGAGVAAPIDQDHEAFFTSAAPVEVPIDADAEIDPSTDPKLELKGRPEVRARRAKLTRYVQWTVGSLAVVCVVAVVKIAAGGRRGAPVAGIAPATWVVSAAASPVGLSAAPLPEPAEPAATAVGAVAPAEDDVPPVPAASSEPAPPAPSEPAATPELVPAPVKTAAEEKSDAKRALDRSSFAEATEAAARSVALDPADGEAWLVLGAAQQSLGKAADARRSFQSCVKTAARGPIGECRAMLR